MKKSIKVAIVVISALLMAGCQIGEGELMKTKTGHQMYIGWREYVDNLLKNVVEPSFNLYAWLQAPEEQKQDILKRHFGSSEVEVLSDQAWMIRHVSGATLRLSMENGGDFSLPGGKMRLLYVGSWRGDVLDNIIFVLENKGNGMWEIRAEDGSIRFELTLGMSEIPESLAETTLSLEGQGMLTHKTIIRHCSGDECEDETRYTFLSYDVKQPFGGVWEPVDDYDYWGSLSKMSSRLVFTSGKVALQAMDEDGNGNAATVTVLGPEEIEIEMDGIVQRRRP